MAHVALYGECRFFFAVVGCRLEPIFSNRGSRPVGDRVGSPPAPIRPAKVSAGRDVILYPFAPLFLLCPRSRFHPSHHKTSARVSQLRQPCKQVFGGILFLTSAGRGGLAPCRSVHAFARNSPCRCSGGGVGGVGGVSGRSKIWFAGPDVLVNEN